MKKIIFLIFMLFAMSVYSKSYVKILEFNKNDYADTIENKINATIEKEYENGSILTDITVNDKNIIIVFNDNF